MVCLVRILLLSGQSTATTLALWQSGDGAHYHLGQAEVGGGGQVGGGPWVRVVVGGIYGGVFGTMGTGSKVGMAGVFGL